MVDELLYVKIDRYIWTVCCESEAKKKPLLFILEPQSSNLGVQFTCRSYSDASGMYFGLTGFYLCFNGHSSPQSTTLGSNVYFF